jgi:hypothetical protein
MSEPKALGASDLLAKQEKLQLRVWEVPTPEFGEGSFVNIAELSADERDELEVEFGKYKEREDMVGIRGFYAAYALCDENRKPLFRGEKLYEAAKVFGTEKSGVAVNRIFSRFCRRNAILATDIEELVGNSPSGQKESGNGGLPSHSDTQAVKRGSKKSPALSTQNSEPSQV